MNSVRLRFPPSPTGKIHIGNIRTALFNWLWARKQGGDLILRIEDTDKQRSTKEFEEIIIKELEWLGIDIDEGISRGGEYGPYRQSERLDIYKKYLNKLLEEDKAYHCYCTKEELDEMREEALARGEMPRYNGRCRNLTQEEKDNFEAEGRVPVVRFKLPEEDREIIINDEIRGEVKFNTSVLDDFIIFKSDGMPTYNFAVVIDDALMKISEVIRGEDHLSNTPKQILLYEALDFDLPRFAHLPLILDEKRAKLKKRGKDDTVYIGEFRKKGYLPEALLNFLALLGWSAKNDEEILSPEDLIAKFNIEDVNKSPAVFDLEKLNWMNGKYIREANLDRIVKLSLPYLINTELINEDEIDEKYDYLKKVIDIARKGIDNLSQITNKLDLFFSELKYEDIDEAKEEFIGEDVELVFTTFVEKLKNLDTIESEKANMIFKEMKKELPVSPRTIYHPVRLALTGKSSGPEMNDIIYILGVEEVENRINKALDLVR